jgi:hypothetical protein
MAIMLILFVWHIGRNKKEKTDYLIGLFAEIYVFLGTTNLFAFFTDFIWILCTVMYCLFFTLFVNGFII